MPDGGGVAPNATPIDPHQIAHEIEQAGLIWTERSHAARLLEKTTSAVKAQLILAARGETPRPSMREAELRAEASEDWLNHVYAVEDARHAANIARVRFEAVQAKFEATRTAEATRRAEMISLGRT